MNLIERLLFDPPGGIFHEFDGITTHFEPRDAALYRDFVPGEFALPSQPIVTIFFADYIRVTGLGMARYQEWSVLLKCAWKEEEGWYPVTMPVTKWGALVAGRYLGFTKYIVDEISMAGNGESRLAKANYKNEPQLSLEFRPELTRPLVPWEKELMENDSFFKGPNFLLVPPGRGPRVNKVILRHVVLPKWSPQPGMARIQVGPGESWKGLVPEGIEFPGTYNHFTGGFNVIPERLA